MSTHSLERKLTFKMTKRKLYWMLLIPSIFIFVIALILLPEGKRNYSVFITPVFWTIYYSVLKIMDLKTKKENDKKPIFR